MEIFVLDSKGFVSVSKSPPLPALVRSAILYNFGSDTSPKGADYYPHVLAGLGDGSVVYFAWKDKQFKDRKTISLGRAPVSLTACQVDGKRAVFAAGNRATVLSWEKKRVHTSPIMLKVPNFKFSCIYASSMTFLRLGDCWSITFEYCDVQVVSYFRHAHWALHWSSEGPK